MAVASKNDLGVKIAVAGIAVFVLLVAVGLGGLKAKESMERRREEAILAKANKKQTEKHHSLLAEARGAAGSFDRIEEAFALFEQAEALGPVVGEDAVVYARLLKNRGEEKAGAERLDEALADIKKAKVLAPDLDGLVAARLGIEKRQQLLDDKIVAAFVASKKHDLGTYMTCPTLSVCVERRIAAGSNLSDAERQKIRDDEASIFKEVYAGIATELKTAVEQVEASCNRNADGIEARLKIEEGIATCQTARATEKTKGLVEAGTLYGACVSSAAPEKEKDYAGARLAVAGRVVYKDLLRKQFLDEGLDIKVRVSGPDSTTLMIEYALFNASSARSFAGRIDGVAEYGFTRVVMSDGRGWGYEFKPKVQ